MPLGKRIDLPTNEPAVQEIKGKGLLKQSGSEQTPIFALFDVEEPKHSFDDIILLES